MNLQHIICKNCKNKGHFYKDCEEPTNSYGIVAIYQTSSSEIKYLAIQRKYSYSFPGIILSYYLKDKSRPISESNIDNEYLISIIRDMPEIERTIIKNNDFKNIWDIIKKLHYPIEYIFKENNISNIRERLRKNFEYIKPIVCNKFNEIPSISQDTMWEFPKGKRNNNESNLGCAIREFTEEISNYIKADDIHILKHVQPFIEKFKSNNYKRYCFHYYVAILKDKPLNKIPSFDNNLESKDIKWMTKYELYDKIKELPVYRSRSLRAIFNRIDSFTTNYFARENKGSFL